MRNLRWFEKFRWDLILIFMIWFLKFLFDFTFLRLLNWLILFFELMIFLHNRIWLFLKFGLCLLRLDILLILSLFNLLGLIWSLRWIVWVIKKRVKLFFKVDFYLRSLLLTLLMFMIRLLKWFRLLIGYLNWFKLFMKSRMILDRNLLWLVHVRYLGVRLLGDLLLHKL